MNRSTSRYPLVTWLQPGELQHMYKLKDLCYKRTRYSYSSPHLFWDQYRPIWCLRTNGIKYVHMLDKILAESFTTFGE
jgi:hypothetical protein